MSDHTPEPMTSNRDKMRCPVCGSQEVDAMTPRTVYACQSSDYDQRPGTFKQSEICSELAALRAQVEALSKEVTSPVLVATNRLADSLANVRAENDGLRAQVEALSKAMFDLIDGKDKGLFIVTVETTIERGRNVNAEHKWRTARVDAIWQAARAALAATGKKV